MTGYYGSGSTISDEAPNKGTNEYKRICMAPVAVNPGDKYLLSPGYSGISMGYTEFGADGKYVSWNMGSQKDVELTIPEDTYYISVLLYDLLGKTVTSLGDWDVLFESGGIKPRFGKLSESLGDVPGAWMGTMTSDNPEPSLKFSDYTWKKIEGDPGKDGAPTGIVESADEPSDKYVGMLWKNTGTTSGLVQGATYRWNGTSWDMYTFRAENIEAESFKGYEFNGSIFKSEFVDEASPYLRYIGEMIQQNGRIKIESKMQTKTDSAEEWIDKSTRKVRLDYDGLGFSETESETETTKNANLTLKNLALLLNLLEDIPKIKCGTKVLTSTGGTSIKVFTIDELNALFGVDDCSAANTACFFANGDGGAQSVHIDGATYLNSAWNAVFNDKSTAGNFRVNYMAIYFG